MGDGYRLAPARCVSWVAPLALLVAAPITASANPADTYGFGSRGTALGGAVVADTQDFAANYYNPSALALAQRVELAAGVVHVNPALRIDAQPSDVAGFTAWLFGFGVPGTFLGVPVGFGSALQLSGDRLSRIVDVQPDEVRWAFHEERAQQVFVATNFAIRPFDFLAVGFGVSFLGTTAGTLTIRGRASQPGFSGQDEFDSNLTSEVIAELQSERSPNFGATWLVSRALTLGASYRGEGRVVLDVDSEFDGVIGVGPLDIPTLYRLESTTVQSFVPRQVTIGGSFTHGSVWRANADLTWRNWSAYQSPLAATASRLEVDTESFPLLVPELPEATNLESARFADRLVVRLGVERTLPLSKRWSVPARLGYAYEPTPVTSNSSAHLVDGTRHVLSFGSGVWAHSIAPWTGRLGLDLHVQWSQFDRTVRPHPDGTTTLAAGGHIVNIGATARAEF